MAENEDKGIDMVERCKYALDQVDTWILNADSKVSISCSIFTGVFGVITFLADKIKEPATKRRRFMCPIR